MARYLTVVKESYRVSTEQQVEDFLKELKEDSRFTLKSFGYKKKEIKEKGQVVEEYFLATVEKEFNIEKDPDSEIDITYSITPYKTQMAMEEE